MRNLKMNLSVFCDYLKDFLVFIILALFIILLLSTIFHNIIKILQLPEKYSSEYKNVIEIENGDIVNIYTIGEGSKTIVILPGYGVQSPIIFYKSLANKLKNDYKVVIIEYPGYGLAKNTKVERTNENIAKDVKESLEIAEINGPYTIIPHSISNIYAMKFVQMYPELVEAVIPLDGQYPAEINEKFAKENIQNTVKNVKICSVLEYTGFARILSYIKPEMYYIDLLKQDEFIKESDIKLYRKMIATNYLTDTMLAEIKNLESNMMELKDYKYPENLPILQILSSETVKGYNDMYGKNKLKKMAENAISNEEIQQTTIINGSHMIHLSSLDEVVSKINNFMNR